MLNKGSKRAEAKRLGGLPALLIRMGRWRGLLRNRRGSALLYLYAP